jgi:indole-3-glycerol phosphate synthase
MNILDKIVADKKREVERLRPRVVAIMEAAQTRKEIRNFAGALQQGDQVALIAEIKRASPSAGIIRADFNPVQIAREYHEGGAVALSVLTDEKYFQGKIEYLQQVRAVVKLPALRKDFIVDEIQVQESAARGADAILLIVAILDDAQLRDYIALAGQIGLAALVEVHNEREAYRALDAGAQIVGINNRDLTTFTVDIATTGRVAAEIPAGKIIVAESGIHTRADVEQVRAAGVHAILVGESLMRSENIGAKARELTGQR